MTYVDHNTGQVVDLAQVGAARNVSIPEAPNAEQLADLGLSVLQLTECPGEGWTLGPVELHDGTWRQTWVPESPLAALQRMDAALIATFNAKAAERRYDSWLTCALRAGKPGPFRDEGDAFFAWVEACNLYGYQVMADCNAGAPIPTEAEFLAGLPTMEWPPSPV